MKREKTRETIKNIAGRYKVRQEDVTDVVNNIFEFQHDLMINHTDGSQDIFPTLRIPYWGIFFVPKDLREKLKEYYKKKNASI